MPISPSQSRFQPYERNDQKHALDEATHRPPISKMVYLSAITTLLYYLLYPIAFLLLRVLSFLSLLAAPFLHLGHYIIHACWYPFHILGKFEVTLLAEAHVVPSLETTNCHAQTLYIFFGVATLVGILTGTSLHYISGFIGTLLKLESRDEAQQSRGRTLAAYRIEKREKQRQKGDTGLLKIPRYMPQASGDVSPKEESMDLFRQDRGRRKGSLIRTTILEEDDSSEGGF